MSFIGPRLVALTHCLPLFSSMALYPFRCCSTPASNSTGYILWKKAAREGKERKSEQESQSILCSLSASTQFLAVARQEKRRKGISDAFETYGRTRGDRRRKSFGGAPFTTRRQQLDDCPSLFMACEWKGNGSSERSRSKTLLACRPPRSREPGRNERALLT